MAMDSAKVVRWRLMNNQSRSSRYPDRSGGRASLPRTSFWFGMSTTKPRSSFGIVHTIGCGRCPVDLVGHARYARYNVAGGDFPVGFSSLRLLTMYFLSQAGPLGGLHRASPVPFRGSYFTPRVQPLDATPQRLTAYWYRQWRFPLIPSPRFVAHDYGGPPWNGLPYQTSCHQTSA
jgi:hypothetical protein